MSSDTTVTVNPAMDKAVNLLEQFIEKLGVTGSDIWNLMVMQSKVEIGIVFVYLTLAVVSSLFIPKLWTKANELEKTENESPKHIATVSICVALCAISFVGTVAFLANIGDVITCIVNPEYWAFEELMSKLKK